jgi:hypothetical protein
MLRRQEKRKHADDDLLITSKEFRRFVAKAAETAIWQLAEITRMGRNRPGKGWNLPRKRDDFKLICF